MLDLSRECPFPPNKPCNKVKELKKRIAELEYQLVQMRYHDDQITQKRVFEIMYCDLLDPEEAMDIFVRNVQRILKGERDNEVAEKVQV